MVYGSTQDKHNQKLPTITVPVIAAAFIQGGVNILKLVLRSRLNGAAIIRYI